MTQATTETAIDSVPLDRYDLYGPVHKGLRAAQCALLIRLGQTDFADTGASAPVLGELRAFLTLAASHLVHEDEAIHPAIAALKQDATTRLEQQHHHHRGRMQQVQALLATLDQAAPGERAAAGRKLYLAFTAFVGEDLLHMLEEETVIGPMLCAGYSDEEIAAIEMRIIAGLTPEESMGFMRLMLPAMNRSERLKLLGGMRQGAPAEVFNAVVEQAAKPTLAKQEFDHLVQHFGLAA